jgi:hypothetical protein
MLDRLLDPEVEMPQQCDYCQGWTNPAKGDDYASEYDPKAVFCSVRCAEKWEQSIAQTARGDFRDESLIGYCKACGGVHE